MDNSCFPKSAYYAIGHTGDENRMKIDAVALRMIGLDKKFSDTALQNLRKEWCKDPSVHDSQKKKWDLYTIYHQAK